MRGGARLTTAAACLLVLGCAAATAVAVTAHGAASSAGGGAITAVKVKRGKDATALDAGAGSGYRDLPGSAIQVRVASDRRGLLLARLTAESLCSGRGYCSARVVVDGREAAPPVGADFAFDSGGGGYEGLAMDRSKVVGPGLHTVKVQVSLEGAMSFRLDDWSFAVELAAA
jgi:hypothetical protein